MQSNEKRTQITLTDLSKVIICGRCGSLFISEGWSNRTHNEWHQARDGGVGE